jgi:hypothetical protein
MGLAATFAVLIFAAWHIYRAAAIDASAFSQIYIHGTPVCVFKEGEQVLARIGNCPNIAEGDEGSAPKAEPYHGHPSPNLPPGHPPIDDGPFTTEKRRTISI